MNQASTVFISYSHDSNEHKKWVLNFSNKLRSSGIDVILDQWDLEFGDDVAVFIESNITDSDKVLIICTDQYNAKANAGRGGTGYEKTIVTRELIDNSQSDRFIPVVRQYSGKDKMPKFLGTRLYADLSDDSEYEVEFKKLARQLRGEPSPDKNPLGQRPNEHTKSIKNISGKNLREIKKTLIAQGGLFDFNPEYKARHFNTLNRLIVDVNKYHNLNILFDVEIPYFYESSIHSMLSGNMFSIPVGDFCGIYEFIYKYLNNNVSLGNSEYVKELRTMISKSTSQDILDYLIKFKNILELFETIMVNNKGIISQGFPDGVYDNHTLAVVRDKKRKLSALLVEYDKNDD